MDVPEAVAEIATVTASSIEKPKKIFFGIVTDDNRNAFIQSLNVGDKITFKAIEGMMLFYSNTNFIFTEGMEISTAYSDFKDKKKDYTGIITGIIPETNDMKFFPDSDKYENLSGLPLRTDISFYSIDSINFQEVKVCFCKNSAERNKYDHNGYYNWKKFINSISIISKEPATQEEQEIVTNFKKGYEERIKAETVQKNIHNENKKTRYSNESSSRRKSGLSFGL